jgi:hypothetical protein
MPNEAIPSRSITIQAANEGIGFGCTSVACERFLKNRLFMLDHVIAVFSATFL